VRGNCRGRAPGTFKLRLSPRAEPRDLLRCAGLAKSALREFRRVGSCFDWVTGCFGAILLTLALMMGRGRAWSVMANYGIFGNTVSS
jgi:hypothetical protein